MQKSMTITILLILGAFMIMVWGCAFAPTSRFKPQEKDTKEETGEVEQIEDFDPMTLDDDDTTPSESVKPEVREAEEKPDVSPDTTGAEEFDQVQGYRIQIFLSSNLENVQKIMEEASEIFTEKAYMKYDAPYYKVRIGDCLTRREADLLREKAVRHGYRDAWVVRTLVNIPKY